MVALRHRRPVAHCGHRLFANAERHLRTIADLQSLHPPELLAETLRVAERCVFRIEQVKYEYPKEVVGEGHTPKTWLRHLVEQRIPLRWPRGCPPAIRATIDKELAMIAEKEHEPVFLTVYDIVKFARRDRSEELRVGKEGVCTCR